MWLKYGLKAQKLLYQGIAHKQHALKGQKLLAQDCYGHKQHALKGQKLIAQDCYGHKQHALKGAKALSPGQRPGYNGNRQGAL
ncbi:MAG: hypothetical protein UFD09_02905, partial [Prevotella sp.]|nr:hypothetical protein [Prevotella sp.]